MTELTFRQFLPIEKEECWEFFSNPENLNKITPTDMAFEILSDKLDKMYPGQIIAYKVKLLPLVKVKWVTEITHVIEGKYFVDEQRFGPYKFWHHEHFFNEVEGGIEVVDKVSYIVPQGLLGLLINVLFIKNKINSIFRFRSKILTEMFQ
ncbi:MAG: SRPBCC family protein [Bacteroidetes bacterium]|nr:SRPBCC family protein [Bacteroidota bacterium]